MGMAKIFKPIRWQSAAAGEQEIPSPALPDEASATGLSPADRVGTQPVTNTSPPGPTWRASDEAAWLALLELVFEETGWPDA